jgi:hypothetical protein
MLDRNTRICTPSHRYARRPVREKSCGVLYPCRGEDVSSTGYQASADGLRASMYSELGSHTDPSGSESK